jgi:type I restriction enzyme S subunit
VGDLVVAGLGDESNPLGRAAAVPEMRLPAINKADCFLVRPGKNVLSEYLLLVLNSSSVLSTVAAHARGTTRLRVSSGSYKQVLVPVPDLTVQSELVSRVARVREMRNALGDEMKHLRQMRRVMLNTEVCPHVQ